MAGEQRRLMRVDDCWGPETLFARLLQIEGGAAGDHRDHRRRNGELLPVPAAPADRRCVFIRVQAGLDSLPQPVAGGHTGKLVLQMPPDLAELGEFAPALLTG